MQATLDGKSMFARAQAKALDLVRGASSDVRVAAVACDDVPRDLAAPSFDRAVAVDAISTLHADYKHADLVACVTRATALARTVEGAGERRIVVFSDLAAHGFPAGKPAAGEGSGVVVEWVPASKDDPPPNHAITKVDVARTSSKSGDALEVTFDVARYLGPAVEVSADLVVGGKRTARMSLPLEGGKTITRQFHHALTTEAGGEGVSIVLGDDALAFDNVVELPFEVPPPLSVLVVDGAPQAVAFRDEVFYLESALRDAKGGKGRMSVDVVAADQLKPGQIASARVVVLANVARLDDATAKALVDHVKAGGGLFMTMGDQVDVDWYDHALADILPAPLRGSKGQALLDDASVAEILSFTRFRAEHPVLRGLVAGDGSHEALAGLSRVRTNTFMLVEPSSDPSREVVMRFSNDAPALVERSVDAGRAMLLATTVDRDWSDLAIRPGFLPLMRQIVLYLGGALDEGGPRIIRVGDVRKIRVPRGTESIEVQPPKGAQRTKIDVDAGKGEVVFRGTDVPGLYRVFAKAPGGEARERVEERFAVMVDPAESNLERAPREVLEAAAPSGAVTRTAEPNDDDVQLWPWLLVAGVALVLAEALILRRRASSS
jgi:hypothetical protein